MDFSHLKFYENKILFGHDDTKNIVAVEYDEKSGQAVIYTRNDGNVTESREDFLPFVLISRLGLLEGCNLDFVHRELSGRGDFRYVAFLQSPGSAGKLLSHLKKVTGKSYGSPVAPYLYYSDMVHQFLLISGKTLFKGMGFENLLRMQLDIETYSSGGYEFPNADREGDRVIIISLTDSTGWSRVISGKEYSEEQMLMEMIREIRERDPDVIEGHNLFKYDLPYLETRAKRLGISLNLGRDGSRIKSHPSRMNIAERTITYPKYEIFGRHIIDTWIMAQLYDITARELESYGLKDVARHFRVAPKDRVYVDPRKISHLFDNQPEILEKYALHDVIETREISRILCTPFFMQTQIFPYSYQNTAVRGNATKIDSLFIREYLYSGASIPLPPPGKTYAGGYTDILYEGVAKNILHVDVASLYPSIMLTYEYFPESDSLSIFRGLLKDLREFRLTAKNEARTAKDPAEADFFNSLQSTFKILINSFYGYLGFGFGHFADFQMAERVTEKGRELVKFMMERLKQKNCRIIEIDTDGIYFTPPEGVDSPEREKELVESLNHDLPKGINLELDGRYKAMFSYKMKNYALLDYDNNMVIKGSGLKSRGLEYFQRKFMEEMFHLGLTGEGDRIKILLEKYQQMMINHEWDVKWFRKSEMLQESLTTYKDKISAGDRNPSAVYELALQSEKCYQPGDQISYYVTGNAKKVIAYRNCKLAEEWNPENPDENIRYYAGKLDELYKKFSKYF